MTVVMIKAHLIFYVKDQSNSTAFYKHVLDQEPSLHVPGMTEFTLSSDCILGLMPEKGIKRLLGERLPDLATAKGFPGSELYLLVARPLAFHQRALDAGAVELSALAVRDWGHRAAYSLDPDGHVLAFAEPIESTA